MTRSREDSRSELPDVVVVVLDCVRAQSVAPWSDTGTNMPFLDTFCRSAAVFDRCLSPASWTIPAHATLFTGTYPWHHGLYGPSRGPLSGRTVFSDLNAKGYRTLSLSANPFISVGTGLAADFHEAYWGEWASHYLRFLGTSRPSRGFSSEGQLPHRKLALGSLPHRFVIEGADAIQTVLPHWWKLANQVENSLDRAGEWPRKPSAPWIEPTLASSLERLDSAQPIACFINLLDAHEPYLPPKGVLGASNGASARYSLVDGRDRQGHNLALDSRRLDMLRSWYSDSIARLDTRLQTILGIIERHRGARSKLVAICSDHGQEFGEEGRVFHEYSAGEGVLRVPLAVRFPDGELAGRRTRSWTTLADLAPTIRAVVDLERGTPTDGRSLLTLWDSPRPDPVLALAEGHTAFGRTSQPGPPMTALSPLTVVGWLGDMRAELRAPDWEPRVTGTRPGRPSEVLSEKEPLAPSQLAAERHLVEAASAAAREIDVNESVAARLSSWGY